MIRVFHLYKNYLPTVMVLQDVSFTVAPGEFVFLTGPSGAGKSTLLRLLFAAERPKSGQILIGGQNITSFSRRQIARVRRSIGVVFQDFKLIPYRTVFDNVSLVLEIHGLPRNEIKKRVWKVLKLVGIEQKLYRYPLELSGGEQQRVAIARALVNDPPIILADEPTGNLDFEITTEIMNIFNYVNSQGTTVVVATHNRMLMQKFKRKVFSLHKGGLQEFVWPAEEQ
ncbi:MAG: cell division ATP-binding protein FtsE [Deltaproteobacteria bacterium]|nr:cell division ATP-binding protein FtsE [Candidatus Anaeroferrophillus wilburensis]MBN2889348.1 cell division ATP-binding protein FtsE [Deltaproteobacteria bacterium]